MDGSQGGISEAPLEPAAVRRFLSDNPDFLRAVDNLADGKRPFGLAGVFGKSHARTNIAEVQISGQTPLEPGDWEHVQEYLALLQIWKELVARWEGRMPQTTETRQ